MGCSFVFTYHLPPREKDGKRNLQGVDGGDFELTDSTGETETVKIQLRSDIASPDFSVKNGQRDV
jgi:hypothetical protein